MNNEYLSEIEIWHNHLVFPLQHWWGTKDIVPFLQNLTVTPEYTARIGFSFEVFSELHLLLDIAIIEFDSGSTDIWRNND